MKDESISKPLQRLRIAYVGTFSFPDDNALARRVLGIAQSFEEIDCEVLIGSGQREIKHHSGTFDPTLHFDIHCLAELPKAGQSRILNAMRHLFLGNNTVKWLDNLTPKPDVVFMTGGFSPYAIRLVPWCRRKGIPLIVDVIEWYQPSHLPGGPLGLWRWNVELATQVLYVRARNIVAISRYLQKYYQNRGCRTLRMPPTLDVAQMPARLESAQAEYLTLVYAGVPGKKDLLDRIVDALLRTNAMEEKLRLVVAGPEVAEIVSLPSMRRHGLSKPPAFMEVLGRVSHACAIEAVRGADFSILLRSPLRYAQAGFPTKVVESLSVGTPVICNLTSDLGDYIHDGREGLICQDDTVEAVIDVLHRATEIDCEQRAFMRQSARNQAEASFDYRNYAEALKTFIVEASEWSAQ